MIIPVLVMYTSTSCNESWACCSEDDNSVDHYSSLSLHSDSDDSEQELRDLEELLYSCVHYEPNYLCETGNLDDVRCSDVHISQLSDPVSDILCNISGDACEREISDAINGADNEVIIIDADVPNDEVAHNASNNLSSERLKRKAASCETSETVDELRTKSKKLDSKRTPGSHTTNNRSSVNLLHNATGKGIFHAVHQPNGHDVVQKKRKLKHKNTSSQFAAAVEAGELIVVDSISESSSDVFCCDLSSDELHSDVADDITLSNININLTHTDDGDALVDVLNSLPDCNWDINAQDRAGGIANVSRYYTPPTSRARCLNCYERGHLARDCTLPKKLLACILCGIRGHVARTCPASLCFNCHQPGHSARDCSQRRTWSETCRRCGMRGHIQMECPDRWRQYHLTTKPGHIVTSKSKKVEQKFCYNCGASGHFGHECDEDRIHSHSFPTLPFIARYDTHNSATSPSASRHKKQEPGTTEHKDNLSSSRQPLIAPEEKQHHSNVQRIDKKAHHWNSVSCHGFRNMEVKVNISSRGTHQVSGFDKREVKDCRNNSTSSQFVTDHENRQKDSFASKHKHHSSTDVSNDRFQVASSKQLVPHGGKHAPRGSSARSHGNTRDSNCYIVQEHPSNRALKRKQKKSRWINSIPRDAHHQYTSNKTRSFVKTAVHGQPLIVTSAKHQKKTQPSSAIHNEFRKKISSYDDNLLPENRKVIKTARGFLMTVGSR